MGLDDALIYLLNKIFGFQSFDICASWRNRNFVLGMPRCSYSGLSTCESRVRAHANFYVPSADLLYGGEKLTCPLPIAFFH